MKNFTITAGDAGQRLNRFLEKTVPSLPATLMYKYLRTKRIKLNGKRCDAADRLNEGDVLELYINDEFFDGSRDKKLDFMHASKELDVIYEDENLALLNKPAGLIVHEDDTNFADTLINRFLRHLYEKGEYSPDAKVSFTPALCNRLDRGTAGIVIAAKNLRALTELNSIIKDRAIEKKYRCVTVKKPPADGIYKAYLLKDEKNNRVTVKGAPFANAKEIITEIKREKSNGELYLLNVTLHTGRTHQIRAHLAFLGCPILGDGKYGNGQENKNYHVTRQALAAYRVKFLLSDRPDSPLFYLDQKSFEIGDVWFQTEYFDV